MSTEEAPPKLQLVAFWQDRTHSFDLPARGEVTLGRAEDNQVRLDHASVSRHHARLTLGEELILEDLGGTNGTYVRSKEACGPAEQTQRLRPLAGSSGSIAIGDSIVIGGITVVLRRKPEAITSFPELDEEGSPVSQVVLRNAGMRAVYQQAGRAALSAISVLILGETGVGKEVLARAIHARSPRARRPFMAINLAEFGEALLEGELFGYERGAFTGAVQARAGLLEAAHGGTVFLDEIGELPLPVQVKLLRVLEERAVRRLGERQSRSIDVRFVAATHRDIEALVRGGKFREDLYFRLNGITLVIPPLRERTDEIEPLVRAFAEAACSELNRPGPGVVSEEAMGLLRRHRWPGNVRELRNVIDRAMALSTTSLVLPEHLPGALVGARPSADVGPVDSPDAAIPDAGRATAPAEAGELGPDHYRAVMKSIERRRIVEALERCGGNQTKAAELLGMSRRTLVAKLGEHDLPRPRKRNAGE